MTLINFLFFVANVLLLLIGFYLIKKKIENLVINKEILESIKKEINGMIVKLNETTINNINLIEEKTRILERTLRIADKKTSGLDVKIQANKDELDSFNLKFDELTYSPQKIIKQTGKIIEKQIVEEEIYDEKEMKEIDEELENMTINEKVRFLLERGFDKEGIRKKIGLSSGEFELIMNIENIRDY
jgi:hypothetical protein